MKIDFHFISIGGTLGNPDPPTQVMILIQKEPDESWDNMYLSPNMVQDLIEQNIMVLSGHERKPSDPDSYETLKNS